MQWHEKTAYAAVTLMRWTFDKFTNYGPKMTEKKWMFRICFLETVSPPAGRRRTGCPVQCCNRKHALTSRVSLPPTLAHCRAWLLSRGLAEEP